MAVTPKDISKVIFSFFVFWQILPPVLHHHSNHSKTAEQASGKNLTEQISQRKLLLSMKLNYKDHPCFYITSSKGTRVALLMVITVISQDWVNCFCFYFFGNRTCKISAHLYCDACAKLACETEKLLGVWRQVGGDVHGGGLSGEEGVKRGWGGRCEWGRGERRRLIFDVRQLAFSSVSHRRFALALRSMYQKEGLHCWLQDFNIKA